MKCDTQGDHGIASSNEGHVSVRFVTYHDMLNPLCKRSLTELPSVVSDIDLGWLHRSSIAPSICLEQATTQLVK